MNERKLKTSGTDHGTLNGYDFTVDDALPPRKAIRQKCLECVALNSEAVRTCHITDCPLWPYRLGHGVTHDPEGKVVKHKARSEAQRKKDALLGERLRGTKAGHQNPQEFV